MKNNYKCLRNQEYKTNEFSIVPIRFADRYKIMRWRNEQIYHLRQSKVLTQLEQDEYFKNVVLNLFDQNKPDQVLFSFLKRKTCIGYGGLVHINWKKMEAEISFLMETTLEQRNFIEYWLIYLKLIEKVAFEEFELKKIFTYSYEVRPKLYDVMKQANYIKEKRIKKAKKIEDEFYDILIYYKMRNKK